MQTITTAGSTDLQYSPSGAATECIEDTACFSLEDFARAHHLRTSPDGHLVGSTVYVCMYKSDPAPEHVSFRNVDEVHSRGGAGPFQSRTATHGGIMRIQVTRRARDGTHKSHGDLGFQAAASPARPRLALQASALYLAYLAPGPSGSRLLLSAGCAVVAGDGPARAAHRRAGSRCTGLLNLSPARSLSVWAALYTR